MTSKILKIYGINEREGPNGKMYYFNLEMENGDKGSIGKKSKDALKEGMELDYEIETKDGKNKFKEIKKAFGFGGGGKSRDYKNDFIGFAMSYAKDLIVSGKVETNDLLPTADKIYQRMSDKFISNK